MKRNAPRRLSQISVQNKIASALNKIKPNKIRPKKIKIARIRNSSAGGNSARSKIASVSSRTRTNSAPNRNKIASAFSRVRNNNVLSSSVSATAYATRRKLIQTGAGNKIVSSNRVMNTNVASKKQRDANSSSLLTTASIAQTTTSSATGAQIRSSVLTSIARNGRVSRITLCSNSVCLSSSDAARSCATSKPIYSG